LPIACVIQKKQQTEVREEARVSGWRGRVPGKADILGKESSSIDQQRDKTVSQTKSETRQRRVYTFLHGISGLSALCGVDGRSVWC
jgi:hypothetical protein